MKPGTPATSFESGGVYVRPEPEIPDPKMLGIPLPDLAMDDEIHRGDFVPLDQRMYRDRPGEAFDSEHEIHGDQWPADPQHD